MRRPTPMPRTASSTHMRLMYAGAPSWNSTAPHPIARPCSRASTNPPLGSWNSCVSGWRLRPGLEAARESPRELGIVLREAGLRVVGCRVGDVDLDETRVEQPHDGRHRLDEPRLLPWAERVEQRAGELVAAAAELRPLGAAALGGAHGADPRVGGGALHRHEAFALERSQEPGEVARVEAEPLADDANVDAVAVELPEHAGGAERAVAAEVVVLQRPDPSGDRAVERTHGVDRVTIEGGDQPYC